MNLTSIHAKVSLRSHGFDEAVNHVLVDLLAWSLVLESGLDQIDGKHASDPNDASNATINQFGREADLLRHCEVRN